MATSDLIRTISRLSKKVDLLLEQLNETKEKLAKELETNAMLLKQHQEDVMALDKAKKDIEFLILSHRLADSPEALVNARKKISGLIRTIDSCIRLINED